MLLVIALVALAEVSEAKTSVPGNRSSEETAIERSGATGRSALVPIIGIGKSGTAGACGEIPASDNSATIDGSSELLPILPLIVLTSGSATGSATTGGVTAGAAASERGSRRGLPRPRPRCAGSIPSASRLRGVLSGRSRGAPRPRPLRSRSRDAATAVEVSADGAATSGSGMARF